MCRAVIKHFLGRTGNNWIQILNCIHYAFSINKFDAVEWPKQEFLTVTSIVSSRDHSDVCRCNREVTDPDNFFFSHKLAFRLSLGDLRSLHNRYLSRYVTGLDLDKPPLPRDVLVIHVRSGDIFRDRPHASYLPPPLDYYRHLAQLKQYRKIYLVSEDRVNPVISALTRELPNVRFRSGSLKSDLSFLCRARRLVIGYGSFGLLVFILSKNLGNLYMPSYLTHGDPLYRIDFRGIESVKITSVDLARYVETAGRKWTNSDHQQQIMLEYLL